MESSNVLQLFDSVPFIQELSHEEKGILENAVEHIKRFEPGSHIVREADFSRTMYILLDGEVSIDKGGQEVGALEPGAIFGEVPLLTGAPRMTNARARENVTVFEITEEMFNSWNVAIIDKFKNQLLKVLIQRLDRMNASLAEFKNEFEVFKQINF